MPISLHFSQLPGQDPVFYPRYFLVTHMFFLASISVLICRIPAGATRVAACLLLVSNGLAVDVDYWRVLDLGNRPGGQAAVAYLEKNRATSEPVVTSSLKIHYSLLYYAKDRAQWYVYGHADHPRDGFLTGPLLRHGEMITDQGLLQLAAEYVWVADLLGGTMQGDFGQASVPIPPH